MRRYSLLMLLSALLLLFSNCQSQRAFLFQLNTATHTPVAAVVHEPLAPTLPPIAIPEPELVAELPTALAGSKPATQSRGLVTWPRPTAKAAPLAGFITPAALQAAPDTSLVRPATYTPLHKIKETDLYTKAVRIVGVLLVLFGIVLFITAFTTTLPGWSGFAFLFYSFVALVVSIPFLAFRSKNSPRRQKS